MSAGRTALMGLLWLALALPVLALDTSPRPTPRAAPEASAPAPRPTVRALAPVIESASAPVRATQGGVLRLSPHPTPRGLAPRQASRVITRPPGDPSKVGRICGSRQIWGRPAPSIAGTLPGCGVRNPVQVVQVAGVRLSTAATMTCETAQALETWVDTGVIPAVGRRGGGVAELRVAAHYSCRTRNHRPGAKISEHGKGKAIDISGIALKDGTVITLLKGWNHRQHGRILRKMQESACGPFGTVLGPESDRFHRDHFHFDVARHRGGPYCR
jgi:hypothetical protein